MITQPTKFERVIDLKTAKTLGLARPFVMSALDHFQTSSRIKLTSALAPTADIFFRTQAMSDWAPRRKFDTTLSRKLAFHFIAVVGDIVGNANCIFGDCPKQSGYGIFESDKMN